MHLPKIVLYNEEQLENFKNKNAHEMFLGNIGLTNISESFSNDQSKLDNEILHFRALHYIKYRLVTSIQQNKDILFWNNSYTRLRNRLTVSNKGLVYSCYKKSNIIHDATRGYDDYISMGYDALIRAVDTFNTSASKGGESTRLPWIKSIYSANKSIISHAYIIIISTCSIMNYIRLFIATVN